MTWPDEETPWYALEDVQRCYARIACAITRFETLLMVCRDTDACCDKLVTLAGEQGLELDLGRVIFAEAPLNDTWARDHGPVAVYGDEGEKYLYDFVFNGWGLKFASDLDNQINRIIFQESAFAEDVVMVDMRPYVLEGGSIDSDGEGSLLTTSECLLSLNRNDYLTQEEIEDELKHALGLKRILWLDHGGIEGDDTDSHVDILARFCSPDTIAYTACDDPSNSNYGPLKEMKEQLETFRTLDGKPYRLLPLPLPDAMYLEGERLPASYANFLILNGAVLLPGCGSPKDEIAADVLREAFPGREVIVIDCYPLLSGHGGLHCVTMNFPEGWI